MVVTHYTGALRTLFYSFVSTAFFGFSFLAVSVSAFFGEPAFFGAKEIVILLPSNKGICSTFAYSSKSFAKRSNNTSPCSLKGWHGRYSMPFVCRYPKGSRHPYGRTNFLPSHIYPESFRFPGNIPVRPTFRG